ncbi:hypothetical protein FACS189468_4660 [Spirochaetia bacterium]|nr:hypothetical protein FACS189468_4660 [Spirochaetia bacterium]
MGLLSKAVSQEYAQSAISPKGVSGFLKNASNIKNRLNETALTPEQQKFYQKMIQNYRTKDSFQGLVLEIPVPPELFGKRKERISGLVFSAVSGFAAVMEMSIRRCLVLFAKKMDRELLAHRLCQSLQGKCLLSFEARDPREAFVLVKPFL